MNASSKSTALTDLLTYLQEVSVLGGRDRLDFRSRDGEAAHLWLSDMVAGKTSSVSELTTGGWTSFGLPRTDGSQEEIHCYRVLSKMLDKARDVTRVAEVRFGVGILGKKGESRNAFYPMISCAAELVLNAQDGIEVKIDGGDWRTESRALTTDLTGKTTTELARIKEQVSELEVQDTISGELQKLKKVLSRNFSVQAISVNFDPIDEQPGNTSETGTVYFSPVLYLQEGRDSEYGKFIGQMLDRLGADEELDLPLLRRVVKGYQEFSEREEGIVASLNYLPQPTSREQRRIAEEIGLHELILVQGPPGTGKSYAIANLLGPLLMSGQRVLVTAEREQALGAIFNQVPEPLQPFVFLTSTKSTTLRSGRAILRMLDNFDKAKEERLQRHKLAEIERLDKEKEKLLKGLRADPLRANITLNDDYAGELQNLTERLGEEKKRFSWFKDEVTDIDKYPAERVMSFVAWQAVVNELRVEEFDGAKVIVPNLALLPDPEELRIYRNLRDNYDKIYHGRTSLPIPGVTSEQVKTKLNRIREWHISIPSHRWSVAAGRSLGDPTSPWRQLAQDTEEYLKMIDLLSPEETFRDYDVEIDYTIEGDDASEDIPLHLRSRPKSTDQFDLKTLQANLTEFVSLFGNNDKISLMARLGALKRFKRLAYLLEVVKLDGKTGDTKTHFVIALRHTELLIWLERLDDRWGEYVIYEIDDAARLRAYRKRSQVLISMIERYEKFSQDLSALERWYGKPQGYFYEVEGLGKLETAYAALTAREETAKAHDKIVRGLEELRRYEGANDHVDKAIRCLDETDLPAYLNSYPRFKELDRLKVRHDQQLTLEKKLGPYFLKTMAHFRAKPQPFKPVDEVEAAISNGHAIVALDSLCNSKESGPLRELRGLEDLRLKHVTQYVTASVKLRFVNGLRSLALFKSNLKLWLKSEEDGGRKKKGRANQETSDIAFEYILADLPCLAMTVAEVTKRLHPEPALFDVLIVDEASQLNVAALSMLYLAKRAVIIGDDKQISPQHSFVRNAAFEEVQHLVSALPQRAFFRKGNSFFDHVKLVADRDIQLREHFRCQPEIIAFSDAICYRGEDEETGLLPLRQAPKKRLPPLKTDYVSDATIDDKRRNKREAKRLVEYLEQLIGTLAYIGKTVGVVTLLGDHQHRLIEKLISQSGISPRDKEDRRLKVGKPADFQGDERDVILLSLVTAPNKSSTISWTPTFTQRFNVAMSRARDQVVLFHSRTLSELPTGNLQQKLLSHCQDYKIERSLSKEDLPVQENDRVLPPGFRSVLQFDVAQHLFNNGYALLLDYRLGSLVIDLVVERSDGKRIALYCLDPLAYHDAELRERLVEQQLILQRVEWKVHEVNGCHFGHNSGAVMERVIDFIEETG